MSGKKIALIIFWSIVYTLGINLFLIPGGLYTTGLTGVAMVISNGFNALGIGFTFALIYLLLNIPGVILGWWKIGSRFTIYSFISIITVSISANIIPTVSLTTDPMLNAIFSGVLMGVAVGGVLRESASTGGLDFYSVYYMMRSKKSFATFNFIVNFVIITVFGFLYGIEIALYTIINLYVITISIGLLFTNHERLTIFIITKSSTAKQIYAEIAQEITRGGTMLDAVGAYSGEDKKIIYMVASRHQLQLIKNITMKHDETSFINVIETKKLRGNFEDNYHY